MISMRLVLVGVALLAVAKAADEEKYTTKFDHINVNDIIGSERLTSSYVKCGLDKGKCSPDGKELKQRIRDALETKCRKCSEKQKEAADTWVHFLYYKRRADYDALAAKYDADGKFRKLYEPLYLRAEGVPYDKTG